MNGPLFPNGSFCVCLTRARPVFLRMAGMSLSCLHSSSSAHVRLSALLLLSETSSLLSNLFLIYFFIHVLKVYYPLVAEGGLFYFCRKEEIIYLYSHKSWFIINKTRVARFNTLSVFFFFFWRLFSFWMFVCCFYQQPRNVSQFLW